MNDSMTDTPSPPDPSFGCAAKSPFFSSPFGYYFPTQLPPPPPTPMHPPPPPLSLQPPLSADSYPSTLERQKETSRPFPSTGLECVPFNDNREYSQLPNAYRYPPGREYPPNLFYPPMRDIPYPSYTEIVPFSDCISVGYPMMPGRFFTYVEQYQFANPPCMAEQPLFNKCFGSTAPGFGEDFLSSPRSDKSYPGTFEPQMFGARPGVCPDLQFCQYSEGGAPTNFCEYSSPNGTNDFVSYTETVNVLSFPSMENSSKSKNENRFQQSPDGCVLISQSKVSSNQNYTSMFRQLSIRRRTPRNKQLQIDQQSQD